MYTVLLVEDEPMELLALKYAVCTNYGDAIQTMEATDGNTAFSLCERYHPEIMIVDINIPGITGLDLIQAVNDMKFEICILITTAYDKTGYIRRALEMGVINYLLKPIDIRELKVAINRCVERLERHMSQQRKMNTLLQGMESVRSYAKDYLVRDILSGKAPKEVLKNVCGWPEDGCLEIAVLCWIPEKEPDYDLFYENCIRQFHEYFSILFSPWESCGLILLQSTAQQESEALMLFLHICSKYILNELEHGRIAGTRFCSSYQELCIQWETLYKRIQSQNISMMFPTISMSTLGSQHKRTVMRQKLLQRLKEHQPSSLISMLKKMVSVSGSYWSVTTLFLEAVQKFDSCIDLREPLEFCMQDHTFKLLAKWLEQYSCNGENNEERKRSAQGHIQKAIALMNKNYGQDLTMMGIAEELGLSAAYFSNLFKQQTGKNFVTFLNEIRIQHAILILNQGESDMEKVAGQCGYFSKKYFFEAFKRTTGQSVTQYRQGDKK